MARRPPGARQLTFVREKYTIELINRLVMYMDSERLNATFAALSDPTRRAILSRLADGESSVKDLARPFRISAPAITKHLKVLERAGLITRSRDAQWRPCRLNARPLREAATWLVDYRRFWEESFDRLDEYLRSQTRPRATRSKAHGHSK